MRTFGAMVLTVLIIAGCSGGSGSDAGTSPRVTIAPTTTEVPHAPRVRVVGDGGGSVVGETLAEALGTSDLIDLSQSDATLISLLDLPADPAAPDEGRLHATLDRAVDPEPDIVVVAIGSEVFDARAPMTACSDPMWSTANAAEFDACAIEELDRLHADQRVMAIVFDILARTRRTKVVLVHLPADLTATGLQEWQRESVMALVNQRIDLAAANVAESGANWGDRLVVVDGPSVVDAVRARGWI